MVSDYDTNKTVQCSSSFVYDKSRQRSLQHFIEFEELPEKSRNIVLPSGEKLELGPNHDFSHKCFIHP